MFYAAFELRCGIEARLQEYLDARADVASKRRKGWQIIDSSKALDRATRNGDKIAEASFLDENGKAVFSAFFTPMHSPDSKNVTIKFSCDTDSPLGDTIAALARVGSTWRIQVSLHDTLPDYAQPYLHDTGA